ncbi:MAG: TIGR00304 family membrane protein [Thermoproteota archaeon]
MSPPLTLAAMLLILAGFLLVSIAFFMELLRALKRKDVEVEKHRGAVVMIGPVPIILASDPKTARMLLVLAIILTLILILLTVFFTYG